MNIRTKLATAGVTLASFTLMTEVIAQDKETIGTMANNVTNTLGAVMNLITATAFIAGICFVIFGLFKLKQHRDNPAQTPLGTPIMYLVIGILLLFLQPFINNAGATVFGSTATPGEVSGFSSLGDGGTTGSSSQGSN